MRTKEELELIDITAILENFIKTVKKFWIPMAATILMTALLFFAGSYIGYQPLYESNVTFSVNTGSGSIVGNGSSGVSQVKESLPYILQTNYMKNMVKEELGLDSFPAEISLESKASANLFVLRVRSADAKLSYDILQSVVENCPDASVYVLGRIELDILDDSGVASYPVNGLSKKGNLIKGMLAGCLIAMSAALVYAMTRHTICKEDDFKKYLSVSCIALIPKITFKKRRKKIDKHIHIYNDKAGYAFMESIRMLRTRVLRNAEKQNAQVIMVTSSIPGEGKSTIASNLALSLGECGAKTILVDLDLRNPSVGKVLGLNRKLNTEILRLPEWKLSVTAGGEEQSDPSQVLNNGQLRRKIDSLREAYDYIILDTPPAAMLADASAVADCADCAVYVVKQDYVRVERIAEGMDALTVSETPILGVVLNGVEKIWGSYGKYGRYGRYGQEGNR